MMDGGGGLTDVESRMRPYETHMVAPCDHIYGRLKDSFSCTVSHEYVGELLAFSYSHS